MLENNIINKWAIRTSYATINNSSTTIYLTPSCMATRNLIRNRTNNLRSHRCLKLYKKHQKYSIFITISAIVTITIPASPATSMDSVVAYCLCLDLYSVVEYVTIIAIESVLFFINSLEIRRSILLKMWSLDRSLEGYIILLFVYLSHPIDWFINPRSDIATWYELWLRLGQVICIG